MSPTSPSTESASAEPSGRRRYVKTAELDPYDPRLGTVFCGGCYGNLLNADGDTTDDAGGVCSRCDGDGTLWIVPVW